MWNKQRRLPATHRLALDLLEIYQSMPGKLTNDLICAALAYFVIASSIYIFPH